MSVYKIYDWAGNELSYHGSFQTFEDAWDYIREHFKENEWSELYVETSDSAA